MALPDDYWTKDDPGYDNAYRAVMGAIERSRRVPNGLIQIRRFFQQEFGAPSMSKVPPEHRERFADVVRNWNPADV